MSRTSDPTADPELATVGDVVPDATSSRDLLVMGPTLSEKEAIAFELLGDGWQADTAPFAISATDPAGEFRSHYAAHVPAGASIEDVFVIDCLEIGESTESSAGTCAVNSPADLTGIGICLSKAYDQYGTTGSRGILLDNLSTLLIYNDLERVYRFVSTLTSRVGEIGDSTVQLLDTDSLTAANRRKFFQLFPTVVEVRTGADRTEFRLRGRTETKWYAYRPRGGENG